MLLKWFSSVATLILILSCNPTTQSSSLQQAKMRDLSRYNQAGPYSIELKLDTQTRNKIEAEIREFLWNHWRQHVLGYIVATWHSKEGEPSTSSYFIEPSEKGTWRIVIQINRMLIGGGSKSQYHDSVEYEAYSVERVEVPKDGLSQRVTISEKEVRSPQTYRLVLKDERGKVLAEI
jgi:hypothetical protein